MQGIVSGGLLIAAFAAVAGLALLVAVRLYRISQPGPSAGQPGPSAGQPGPPGLPGLPGQSGVPGEPPDA